MTKAEKEWHEKYANLPHKQKTAIDRAFEVARKMLATAWPTAGDHKAEILIAAMSRYVMERPPSHNQTVRWENIS